MGSGSGAGTGTETVGSGGRDITDSAWDRRLRQKLKGLSLAIRARIPESITATATHARFFLPAVQLVLALVALAHCSMSTFLLSTSAILFQGRT